MVYVYFVESQYDTSRRTLLNISHITMVSPKRVVYINENQPSVVIYYLHFIIWWQAVVASLVEWSTSALLFRFYFTLYWNLWRMFNWNKDDFIHGRCCRQKSEIKEIIPLLITMYFVLIPTVNVLEKIMSLKINLLKIITVSYTGISWSTILTRLYGFSSVSLFLLVLCSSCVPNLVLCNILGLSKWVHDVTAYETGDTHVSRLGIGSCSSLSRSISYFVYGLVSFILMIGFGLFPFDMSYMACIHCNPLAFPKIVKQTMKLSVMYNLF